MDDNSALMYNVYDVTTNHYVGMFDEATASQYRAMGHVVLGTI